MPDRVVRFTEQFFSALDDVLPTAREPDGRPSVTDFLLLDLPTLRDALGQSYDDVTLPTATPSVRVLLASSVLVGMVAIYMALEGDVVEAFWIEIE